tara:strand:- start:954 stop:1253 length:300 start_codon:yes stop_codon:yes gene_type:complete
MNENKLIMKIKELNVERREFYTLDWRDTDNLEHLIKSCKSSPYLKDIRIHKYFCIDKRIHKIVLLKYMRKMKIDESTTFASLSDELIPDLTLFLMKNKK